MEIHGLGLDGWIGGWDSVGDRGQSDGVLVILFVLCLLVLS